jgi:hypothetical protein
VQELDQKLTDPHGEVHRALPPVPQNRYAEIRGQEPAQTIPPKEYGQNYEDKHQAPSRESNQSYRDTRESDQYSGDKRQAPSREDDDQYSRGKQESDQYFGDKRQTPSREDDDQYSGDKRQAPSRESNQPYRDTRTQDTREHEQPMREPEPKTTEREQRQLASESRVQQLTQNITTKDQSVTELGHIHFFYRPKVDLDVKGIEDVHSLYILLTPMSGKHRLITLPKKILPGMHKRKKHYAFVGRVSENIDDIIAELAEQTYTKTTGGHRKARSCVLATGVYGIFFHDGHTHLGYVIEYPTNITDLHKQFNLEQEGSYVISVKNPTAESKNFVKKKRPNFPSQMMGHFSNKEWVPLQPYFLEFPGTELMLVESKSSATSGNIRELEDFSDEETMCAAPADIFQKIKTDKYELPTDPVRGKWI